MEPSLPYQGLSVNGPTHAGEGTRTARSNPRTRGAFPRYIKTHHKQRVSPVRDNPLSHLDGFQQRSGFPARSAGKRGPQKPSKGGFYGSVDLEYLENLGIHRLGRKPIHYIRRETNRAFPAPDSEGSALLRGTGGPTASAQSDPPRFALAGTSTLAIPSDCIPIPSAGRTARSTLRLILHCLPDPTQSHPPRSRRGIRCTLPKRG